MVCVPVTPAFGRQGQEEQEFRLIGAGRDDSAVKSTSCSCRGPRLRSQIPTGSFHPSVTPVAQQILFQLRLPPAPQKRTVLQGRRELGSVLLSHTVEQTGLSSALTPVFPSHSDAHDPVRPAAGAQHLTPCPGEENRWAGREAGCPD